MRLPLVTRSLISGAVVYVLASACAATSHQAAPAGDAADGAQSPSDVIRDAIADVIDEVGTPVHDAKAEGPADVATEPCTTTMQYQGLTQYFAVHNYPGKTRTDLAGIQILSSSTDLAGYTDNIGGLSFVKDGSVAVYCGLNQSSKTITFILP